MNATLAQEYTNNLCTLLVTRKAKGGKFVGGIDGGFLFERTAQAGMAVGLTAQKASPERVEALMAPYLAAWFSSVDAVNEAVAALANVVGGKAPKAMKYKFSAKMTSRCTASCWHAKRDVCECACAGAGHGVGYHAVPAPAPALAAPLPKFNAFVANEDPDRRRAIRAHHEAEYALGLG